jgi:hypothetical protein
MKAKPLRAYRKRAAKGIVKEGMMTLKELYRSSAQLDEDDRKPWKLARQAHAILTPR